MSKDGEVESSVSERPRTHGPRRLADWINPTGAKKVHSLVDKIYKMKALPSTKLYGEYRLVNLISLIPSISPYGKRTSL